jgi:hypothetical protein
MAIILQGASSSVRCVAVRVIVGAVAVEHSIQQLCMRANALCHGNQSVTTQPRCLAVPRLHLQLCAILLLLVLLVPVPLLLLQLPQ